MQSLTEVSLVWELVHWLALVAGTLVAIRYFRDLGDVTQAIFSVSRKNMIFAIRHENMLIGAGLAGTGLAVLTHLFTGAGIGWLVLSLTILNLFW